MSPGRPLFARMRSLFRRGRVECDMAAEMQIHLELQEEANRARGMDVEEARYAARRQFGGMAQVQERCREQRDWRRLESFGRDLRLAVRLAVRLPGFTAIVLLTLACGIGASTAVFSGVNALLLRPLPVRDPGKLVVVASSGPGVGTREFPYSLFERNGDNRPFPYAFFALFRDRCTTLSEVVAVTGWTMQRSLQASGFGAAEPGSAVVEEVSGNYFGALGVSLALGRGIDERDDQPGGTGPVVVVSYDYWQGRLGGDLAVLGKTLHLDGNPVTIVGVAARGFIGAQVGMRCDLWFPIRQSQVLDANMPWGPEVLQNERQPLVHILGRVRDGVSRQQAATELDGIFQYKLAELDPRRTAPAGGPEWDKLLEQHIALAPAGSGYGGVRSSLSTPLRVLMVLVGLLQLAACANVAGLLLARGAAREHEFAIRAALGASRGRVVVQLLTECGMLTVVAGGLGIVAAVGASRFLQRGAAGLEMSLDTRVLLFALGLTLLTALVAGLVPAWRLSRRELGGSLKPARVARSRLNAALVALQIGFAFVLLAVAGLFGRTLYNLATADTGFARQNRLLFDLGLAPETPPPDRAAVYQRIAAELEGLAGVESASYYQGINLLGDMAFVLSFDVPGVEAAPGQTRRASLVHVGPRFFETMGVPLLRGRDFGLRDEGAMATGVLSPAGGESDNINYARRNPVVKAGNGVPALVIGEWAAGQLFGESDPLGRRIRLGKHDFEVVGVAKDVKYGGLRDEPRYLFYLATSVTPNAMRVTYVVRTVAAPAVLAGSCRAAVRQVDARAQSSGFRSITDRLDQATSQERFTARLAGFFGVFALALSGLGLFGVMSFTVSRRTREIGIRLALGSPLRSILRMVAQEGLVLWACGCGIGVAGALAFSQLVAGLFYQVQPGDPLTYAFAAGALLVVAALACFCPAWRAARVNPVESLRAE